MPILALGCFYRAESRHGLKLPSCARGGVSPVTTRDSRAVGALPDQREEFGSGFFLAAEAAQHRRSDCGGMLFLYSAHHHTEMAGFDHHSHSLRVNGMLDGLGDLGGEALLDLQAARESVDEARDLAQADHFSVRDIGHVHFAKKGQEMMLAEAEHFDVFYDHHFVVAHSEQRFAQKSFGIILVALDQKPYRLFDSLGSALQAFAIGIFSQADDHLADQFFIAGAGQSGGGVGFGGFHRPFSPAYSNEFIIVS